MFDIMDLDCDIDQQHVELRKLRETDPVWWDEKNQVWLVTKYEDVRYVSKTPKLFCSGNGVLIGSDTSVSIVTMDDPEHAKMRGILSSGFTPRLVQHQAELVDRVMTETLDDVIERGECDFVEDIAVPLPMRIIAHMVGFDDSNLEEFRRWTDTMFEANGAADEAVLTAATEAFGEFSAQIVAALEERRRSPRPDMLSALVAAETDGVLHGNSERLQDDELVMFCVLLITAGNETTRNSISRGMQALMEHPETLARIRDDRRLLPGAIEEILRWTSVVRFFRRTVTQDTELRGKKMRAGDHVAILYPSANRDADVFEDPFEFNIDRDPNDHLAFGFGPHFCMGANLARLEMRVAFEQILDRMDNICLAPGAVATPGCTALTQGLAHLPIVFTPREKRGVAA